MRRNSILITIFTLIIASCYALHADDEAITISPKWQNFRPNVTCNTETNEFFVTWIQAEESISYKKPNLVSAIISVDPEIRKLKGKKITRNSSIRTWAPYVSSSYNASLDLYYVVWQDIDITNGEKRLILTNLSSSGKFEKRAIVLAENEGFLLDAPILLNLPDSKDVIVCWNEISSCGYASKLLRFQLDAPHSAPKIASTISVSNEKTWDRVRSIFPAPNGYLVYGYTVYLSKEKNQQIFSLSLDENLLPISEFLTVTKNSLKESSAFGAASASKGEIVLYNKSYPGKDKGLISVLNFPESREKVNKPYNIASPDKNLYSAKLLDKAFDGKHRAIWLEKSKDSKYLLKIQALAAKGKPTGKQIQILESDFRITDFDICYNKEKDALCLVWTEDLPQLNPEDAMNSRIRMNYFSLSQL